MPRERVLVLDPGEGVCGNGCCARLVETLREIHSPGSEVFEATTLPDGDWRLVFLRGIHQRAQETIAAIRRQCPNALIAGVFCHEIPGHELPGSLDDFLCCPFHRFELEQRVRRMLPSAAADAVELLACELRQQYRLDGLVGNSRALVLALGKLPPIARSGSTVLITGATGTGKEFFARGVHYLSRRSGMPFVPVNCAALPDHLFENEMFGHAKGAYTDASAAEPGLIQVAEGGTLFLDEVETLSPAAQAKLLRFLQEREFRPLGSPRMLTADVRIVAATNADVAGRARSGNFREDLYHRLSVLRIHVPSLTDRAEDIPVLARHFAHRIATQISREHVVISQAAVRKLMRYGWPGNVRELESVIHRAVVLAGQDNIIRPDDIDFDTDTLSAAGAADGLRAAKDAAVARLERAYLTELMTAHRGNVTQAAKSAGKQRRVLQRMLQKHGLDRDSFFAQ